MRKWIFLLFLAAVAVIVWQIWPRGDNQPATPFNPVYKGKTLDAWFFGNRTNFLSQTTREAAQAALDGVGTNAFPFLLHKISNPHGSPVVYLRAWLILPPSLKRRFRRPLGDDDIRSIALGHLWKYPERFSQSQLHAFAALVPRLQNPRVRMYALTFLRSKYGADPEFTKLCQRLLDDPNPAIRIEAAIPLSEAAIVSDPREPRLPLILLPAFEQKSIRDEYVELNSYTYGTYPPGTSPLPRARLFPRSSSFPVADQAEFLKRRIEVALIRLEPYLTPQQLSRFTFTRTNSPAKPHALAVP